MKKTSFFEYLPLLEILNEAMVIYDMEKILWANEEYAQIRGYESATAIIGLGTSNTVHPDEEEKAKKIMVERFANGGKTRGIWRMRRIDGSYVKLEAHCTTLPNVDNSITFCVVRPIQG